MKSTEPSVVNGGVNKPPPYPVEGASMIAEPPPPDPHTADLVTAVQYGYYDRVVELIEPAPHLASTPIDGNITLLHWAAINNRIKIAEYLINKRAQVDVIGGELNSTPLHWAIRDGKLPMVVYLLGCHAQPTLVDGEGFSSIHLASMFGHTDILAYLIAKGQDIDLPDKHGMTPLMHAAARIKQRDPTQLLIRLGAQINLQNSTNKYTALHYAILNSNREAIQLLINAGAKTDIRNSDNQTPSDLLGRWSSRHHMFPILSPNQYSNENLPKFLQFNKNIRRLGTKLLPYLILIFIACILQLNLSILFKAILIIILCLLTKGYTMIFFDNKVDDYLPIAIAQASIFWLYVCYFYFFLEYIHVFSLTFLCFLICTYFFWTSYYLAQKRDPGVIVSDRDQQYQNIVELVEENLFDYENFCTYCLIQRPLRSKHCRECHRCISKFDHHCPWIDNCVGEKNIRYFTGFLLFAPICLAFYLHGAYLFYRDHCHLFESESIIAGLKQVFFCSPAILWFTSIALLHITWITGLFCTILFQVATGYTTNEKINAWRYRYLKSKNSSPFSLGCQQNLIDLLNHRLLWLKPTNLDWTRIYSIEDFYRAVPMRLRRNLNISSMESQNV